MVVSQNIKYRNLIFVNIAIIEILVSFYALFSFYRFKIIKN